MKSASPFNLAKQDFIAQRFHPRSGFIPPKADLIEHDGILNPALRLCLAIIHHFVCAKHQAQALEGFESVNFDEKEEGKAMLSSLKDSF